MNHETYDLLNRMYKTRLVPDFDFESEEEKVFIGAPAFLILSLVFHSIRPETDTL